MYIHIHLYVHKKHAYIRIYVQHVYTHIQTNSYIGIIFGIGSIFEVPVMFFDVGSMFQQFSLMMGSSLHPQPPHLSNPSSKQALGSFLILEQLLGIWGHNDVGNS